MSTIRGVRDRRFKFVQLLNSMFEDSNLSLKAKGFIGYCLTKPSTWHFSVKHLRTVLKEGEKAIYAVINECVEQGYAIRYQPRSENGGFHPWETVVSDSNHEIQEITREIKESFTVACFGDAQKVDAEKEGTSNTDCLVIIKPPPPTAYLPKRKTPKTTKAVAETQSVSKTELPTPKQKPKETTSDKEVEDIKRFAKQCIDAGIPFESETLHELGLKNLKLLRSAVKEFWQRSLEDRKKIKTPDAWLVDKFNKLQKMDEIF